MLISLCFGLDSGLFFQYLFEYRQISQYINLISLPLLLNSKAEGVCWVVAQIYGIITHCYPKNLTRKINRYKQYIFWTDFLILKCDQRCFHRWRWFLWYKNYWIEKEITIITTFSLGDKKAQLSFLPHIILVV